ncbi:MAG TPA: LTA synthase family protein [bacterium]|nr:LTA synthase family protein [bacterium]HNZ51278.1 LTA synthase family protein [bacterium]HOH85173.1 LTA synthase family protein [bacterium]HOQ91589.1 LTA synthase family protein [bacterium]HQA83823.1 LTA synthase family protein [bacterium]
MSTIILFFTAAIWAYVGHLATFQWTGLGLTRWSYIPDLAALILLVIIRQPFCRRRGWLIIEQGLLATYFYLSQIIKLRFFGWPLMPSDFSAAASFWRILGDINPWWQIALIGPLVLWLSLIIINWRWPRPQIWFRLGLASLVLITIFQYPARPLAALDKLFGNSYWDQKTNYAQRGPWLYLLQESWRQQLAFQLPSRIEVEQAAAQLDYRPISTVTTGSSTPNIYFIVVESLWQPDLPAVQFNRSPWADNWQQQANLGLGQALSPTFGGKTANAEFELLCGWPNVQAGMIFNGGIKQSVPCLPNYLKQLGYRTVAFHANVPAFWNRHNIYPLLGFDHFYSLADYRQDDMNDEFMADSSFYQQTLDKIKAQDQSQPSFNYLLTYSNHLGYPLNANRPAIISTTPAIAAVAERYFNSLYYTTKELAEFLEQLHQIDPAAVVMVVGDHWPFLGDDNIGYRQGGWWPDGQLSAQQIWQRSITPLWARQANDYWLKDRQLAFYQLPDALWQQLGFGNSPFATWSASLNANWRPLDSLGEPGVIKNQEGDYQFCYPGANDDQCSIINHQHQATRTLILDIFRGRQDSQISIDEAG